MASSTPSIASSMPGRMLEGPDVWRGADVRDATDWVEPLSAQDIAELEQAYAGFKASGTELVDLRPETFVLGPLGDRLRAIRHELLEGRGFVLLRGLPVERYDVETAATMYFGLGSYLGHPVSQNAKGHLLGHVIDLGRSTDDTTARTYQTNERQFYHADSCDIVGLLCLRKAKRGGTSTIVSSVHLHNEVMRRAPDLLSELFEPAYVDRRGEVPKGAKPWYEVPVLNWLEGKLTAYYVRRYIDSAQRFDAVPRLTERRIAAYDLLDEIADEPDTHLAITFEPGDIQFLHNHQILHDRTAYEDYADPTQRRHLLRLWLCPSGGRRLPDAYRQRWGSIEPGNRGGIVVEGATLKAPLTPE